MSGSEVSYPATEPTGHGAILREKGYSQAAKSHRPHRWPETTSRLPLVRAGFNLIRVLVPKAKRYPAGPRLRCGPRHSMRRLRLVFRSRSWIQRPSKQNDDGISIAAKEGKL